MSLAAISPIIGGVGGIIASTQGNRAANRAANMQYALGQEQLAFNRQQAAIQNAIAERLQRQGVAGQRDGLGNEIRYDEATNTWVTALTPQQRQASEAALNEEILRLVVDQALRRRGMQANESRRAVEGRAADAAMARYTNTPEVSQEALRGTLMQQAGRGVNQAFDDVQRDMSRQAVRAGTGGSQLVAELARKRGEAQRDAYLEAELKSYGADGINQQRRSSNLNEYTTLASRASNFDDTPLASSGTNNAMLQAITQRIGGAGQAGTGAAYATGVGTNAVNTGFNSAIGSIKPTPGVNIGAATESINSILSGINKLYNARNQGTRGRAQNRLGFGETED